MILYFRILRSLYSVMMLVAVILYVQGCQTLNLTTQIKEGDILFQDLDCGDLCDAIEAVTEGADGRDFSHCGMAVNIDGELQVVEAIGEKVMITSLDDFFTRSGDNTTITNIIVGRVKPSYKHLIDDAIHYSIALVGEQYDDAFLLENGRWYCSELIFEVFKRANENTPFFELQPMTFKDPSTEDFFPVWERYYEELGMPIPEGKPGLNPGLLSRSDRLQIVNLDPINR